MASQIDFNVDAVLPAGGVGHRMGLETPKQVNLFGQFTKDISIKDTKL